MTKDGENGHFFGFFLEKPLPRIKKADSHGFTPRKINGLTMVSLPVDNALIRVKTKPPKPS